MNYSKHYNLLIWRAKTRDKPSYSESHHIVPSCMGGSDEASNLVDLTPEEHYVAHQLLVKIYNGNYKLVNAATMMCCDDGRGHRMNNKLFGWLRRRHSEAMSESQSGVGNSQYGKRWISHELIGSVRVPDNLLSDFIEQGWVKGRNIDFTSTRQVESRERRHQESSVRIEAKRSNDKIKYSEWYAIYQEYGFDQMVKSTGYSYSQANFVSRASKLLDNFVPQNGKRRGLCKSK